MEDNSTKRYFHSWSGFRKTKIRPLYVPNPTDDDVPKSAIFRITGSCYFWQFSIFDGDENSLVYTDHQQFNEDNQSNQHSLTINSHVLSMQMVLMM